VAREGVVVVDVGVCVSWFEGGVFVVVEGALKIALTASIFFSRDFSSASAFRAWDCALVFSTTSKNA